MICSNCKEDCKTEDGYRLHLIKEHKLNGIDAMYVILKQKGTL